MEKPIDKVTPANLNFCLRFLGIELHSTLLDKVIDCIKLIEELGDQVTLKDLAKLQASYKQK